MNDITDMSTLCSTLAADTWACGIQKKVVVTRVNVKPLPCFYAVKGIKFPVPHSSFPSCHSWFYGILTVLATRSVTVL